MFDEVCSKLCSAQQPWFARQPQTDGTHNRRFPRAIWANDDIQAFSTVKFYIIVGPANRVDLN